MPKRRRFFGSVAREMRRHYAYAACSAAEYDVIKRFARREGLSVSDFVRRCVNGFLLDEGDDVPLLTEYKRDRVHETRGSR